MPKNYAQKLRDPRWQRLRLQALNAADWSCNRCHDTLTTLHVHHRVYRRIAPWEYDVAELEVLCALCHQKEHKFLRGTNRFKQGHPYNRAEISNLLGGQTKGFLPMNNGHVVCGCFRRQYNPDAPQILLPGDLGRIIEPAELFCRQTFPVPIFVSESGNDWIYKGDFHVENWTENAVEIALHNKRAGRKDISRVIFLRAASK
jgi:hypothetical protein